MSKINFSPFNCGCQIWKDIWWHFKGLLFSKNKAEGKECCRYSFICCFFLLTLIYWAFYDTIWYSSMFILFIDLNTVYESVNSDWLGSQVLLFEFGLGIKVSLPFRKVRDSWVAKKDPLFFFLFFLISSSPSPSSPPLFSCSFLLLFFSSFFSLVQVILNSLCSPPGFTLTVTLLPQPSKCWNYKHALLHPSLRWVILRSPQTNVWN